jgi:dihydrofolate reductase
MADQAPAGVPSDFIGRMNSMPKYVASTPSELTCNATAIDGDVAAFVHDLKCNGRNLLKYGNGPLDATLTEHGLIDEFHLFLTPGAIGKGKHLFESIDTAPHLRLVDVTRLDSGVLILVYAPK